MEELRLLLSKALKNLNRAESTSTYLTLLQNEWYNSVDELLMAIEDVHAFKELKLPGRLKIELKLLLKDKINEFKKDFVWFKCFSLEHKCFYYCNSKTSESSWDPPSEIYDYDSTIKVLFNDYNKNNLVNQSLSELDDEKLISLLTKLLLNGENSPKKSKKMNNDLLESLKTGIVSPSASEQRLIDDEEIIVVKDITILPVNDLPKPPKYSPIAKLVTSDMDILDAVDAGVSIPVPINYSSDIDESENNKNVETLLEMGFDKKDVMEALALFADNLADSTSYLLEKKKL